MSDTLSEIQAKAREVSPRIILPESDDERVVEAAVAVSEQQIAHPVLLEPHDETLQLLEERDISSEAVSVLRVSEDELAEYADVYADVRNVSTEIASRMLEDNLVLSGLLTRIGEVDSTVAGAVYETAEVLAVANGIVGFDPAVDTGSSFFIMDFDRPDVGENGTLLYADCGVNISPSENQLANIALSTAETAEQLFGWTPKVAMLSFSTKGSANHESVEKIRTATELAQQKQDSLIIDGELQADAALVSDVAEKKIEGTPMIQGDANILIFPDLQAGNISYKLSDRLFGATALGPLLQGYARPLSDLSRGAIASDIADILTVTAAKAAVSPSGDDGVVTDSKIVTGGALHRSEQSVLTTQ